MSVDDGRERLATFVQISDLHIGNIDLANGDAEISPAAAQVYMNTPFFDGLLGHHGAALEELESFCEGLVDAGEEPRLIVTGDFTRCGSVAELTQQSEI